MSRASHAADALSATVIAAAMMKWLPPVAALLGVVWYVMQIVLGIDEWRQRRQRARDLRRRASDCART